MNRYMLLLSAVVAALLTIGLMMAVFSGIVGALFWLALDYLFPTVSGVTLNTNTDWWGWFLLLPLAVAGGLVCGALVLDPKMSPKTEAFAATAVFALLAVVSGVNFWAADTLINVNGQMFIDLTLGIASLVVIGLLTRWKPSLTTASAVQRVVLFLVTVFGFVLPLYYATSLLLIRLGYREGLGDLSAFMKFVTGAVGLAAAISPSIITRRRRSAKQNS